MSTPAFENAQRSAQLCETTDVLPNDELQTQLATLPNSLSKTHHLLKHQLPEGDVSHHFGTSDLKCIVKIINKMGQRELQAKFREVFQTPTYSNNNNWLRRKLMEAAGLPAPRVQQKAKKGGRKPTSPKKKKSPSKTGDALQSPTKRKPPSNKMANVLLEGSAQKRRSARQKHNVKYGQLVWASLKEHGYWPAQVIDPSTVMTAHEPPFPDVHVLVQYINIGSYAWVPQWEALDLAKYWDNLSMINNNYAFQMAVIQAGQLLKPKLTDSKSERQISLQTWFSFDQPLCHVEGHGSTEEATALHAELPEFSHDSTDDILATNHLSHLCESHLLSANECLDGADFWFGAPSPNSFGNMPPPSNESSCDEASGFPELLMSSTFIM